MTTTTGQAQHTLRRVLDAKRRMQWTLRPILHAIQDELAQVPRPPRETPCDCRRELALISAPVPARKTGTVSTIP